MAFAVRRTTVSKRDIVAFWARHSLNAAMVALIFVLMMLAESERSARAGGLPAPAVQADRPVPGFMP